MLKEQGIINLMNTKKDRNRKAADKSCHLQRLLLEPEKKVCMLHELPSDKQPQFDVGSQKRHILAQWPCNIYLTEERKKRGPDKVFSSVVFRIKVSPLQNLTVMFHRLLEFNS